jgi:hypothetical protein
MISLGPIAAITYRSTLPGQYGRGGRRKRRMKDKGGRRRDEG